MTGYKAKFKIGQIVQHKLFDYSGVIFDIDPIFQSSETGASGRYTATDCVESE